MSKNFYEVMTMTQFMSKHVACHVDIITVLSDRENVFRLLLTSRIHVKVFMRLFTNNVHNQLDATITAY